MGRRGDDRGSIVSHHSNTCVLPRLSIQSDSFLTSLQRVTNNIHDLSDVLQNRQGRTLRISLKEWREDSDKVELNVGGCIFPVTWELML